MSVKQKLNFWVGEVCPLPKREGEGQRYGTETALTVGRGTNDARYSIYMIIHEGGHVETGLSVILESADGSEGIVIHDLVMAYQEGSESPDIKENFKITLDPDKFPDAFSVEAKLLSKSYTPFMRLFFETFETTPWGSIYQNFVLDPDSLTTNIGNTLRAIEEIQDDPKYTNILSFLRSNRA